MTKPTKWADITPANRRRLLAAMSGQLEPAEYDMTTSQFESVRRQATEDLETIRAAIAELKRASKPKAKARGKGR